MVGMPTAKLHNKKQLSEYWMRIDQLITEGSFEGEVGNIRKDRTAFPTYMSVTLLKNNEGKTIGSLAITRDITESKRREKELNLYREKMARAEKLASVGTLSATLAHELAQPLTVIRLSIENALVKLETTPSIDAVTRNIEDSLTEVSNITSIVNRFRNYARRSSKTVVSEIDLKAVAERTLQLLSHSAQMARVTLRLKGMNKLPPIYSYEKDLEQLFFALVENAVQAADGKESRRLIIGGDVKDEHIELQFSDNCGGIAPESLDRIFEPFFTTRPVGEGTGLGLCIVEHVVSRARGKVRVESQAGKGTTFFVTLPINKDEQS
jgi:C4-dicarboxylate-specific signal transduction histidine kinase